jgi:tungstate transport system substrate-binding protein
MTERSVAVKTRSRLWALAFVLMLAPGCRKEGPKRIVLATTTSVRDCGLLDVLLPAFEKETGIPVAPIAVGSGEALRMGRDGNADVLLVHDPAGEEQLAKDGLVAADTEIMRSRFVIVGPATDPAGVRGLETGAEVFQKLAAAQATFVSRGDDSGTHRLEKKMWKAAGREPPGPSAWYLSVGAGMMHALRVAGEKQGYCLTDTATWLKAKKALDLVVLVDSGAPEWANIYSVVLLSPEKFPGLNHEGARRFSDFLVNGTGHAILRDFGVAEYGAPVFQVR